MRVNFQHWSETDAFKAETFIDSDKFYTLSVSLQSLMVECIIVGLSLLDTVDLLTKRR